MPSWTPSSFIAVALMSFATLAGAQTTEPPPVGEKIEILPIAFSPDGLSGPGGERLRDAMTSAQFIALGEDHGLSGAPELAQALAHDAEAIAATQDVGPVYHAVEVGPHSAEWIAAQIETGGVDSLVGAFAGRPWAMPFLTNVEDAALAAPFARSGRLWGIDQEFIGAPSILLELLAARTKDKAVRARLAAWLEQDRAALSAGNFGGIMMSTAGPTDFAELQKGFPDDAQAGAIIDALAESARIYRLNNDGQYLQNNEERRVLMQNYFLVAYRAAAVPAPHVLFKMGAYHMGRGTTPTSIYDIGSLLPGLAAANGHTSLHIAYVPMGGMVRAVKPSPEGFTGVQPYRDEAIAPILNAAGLADDAVPAQGHVLIPLAPLRHNLQGKKLRDLPTFSRFLLIGFDYLVTTRGAEPATHFEAVGKPAPR